MAQIKKVLIANRGEIACRVIRTAKRLGIKTVAVYSSADVSAVHTTMADEAYAIGAAPSSESYLKIDKIIAVAKQCGANAIHPGYGFLSENPQLVEACEANEIVFIGPPASAMRQMSAKDVAKDLMADAGVPLVPGVHGEQYDDIQLAIAAQEMGYPVLIKASAGGGGKGMRVVRSGDEFVDALASAKREAMSSFADDTVLIEKYLPKPRHVEVQIFCDSVGGAVYLFERDCSLQRRHQKVIEEAPAFDLTEELRVAMGEAAVAAARAIDYVGAGTVEFLLLDQQFYFMEMNTRLQVEHPVTELITGVDLVQWQFIAAQGQALPLTQEQLQCSGHAIEARFYAEDPEQNFLPMTGVINHWQLPQALDWERIDTGVASGSEVGVYYDPMLAKLIVHGADREQARTRLLALLQRLEVSGLRHNGPFLQALLQDQNFIDGNISTQYLDLALTQANAVVAQTRQQLASVAVSIAAVLQCQQGQINASAWTQQTAWRLNAPAQLRLQLVCDEQSLLVSVVDNIDNFLVTLQTDQSKQIHRLRLLDQRRFSLDDEHYQFHCIDGLQQHILLAGYEFIISPQKPNVSAADEAHSGEIVAPMTGTLQQLLVKAGDQVQEGDVLAIVEAMKMEHSLRAPRDAVIDQVLGQEGEVVDHGQCLLRLVDEE